MHSETIVNSLLLGKTPIDNSSKRSEKEAHVNDILSALQKFDKYNTVPFFVVDALSLGMLLKAHPEELNSLSFIERQNNIEDRVRKFQESVSLFKTSSCNIRTFE